MRKMLSPRRKEGGGGISAVTTKIEVVDGDNCEEPNSDATSSSIIGSLSLRRGSAPPSALSGEIISEQEILQSAVTASKGGYLAVGTGHMSGIRKNSQPDLRKTSTGNNGHISRGKGHEKSGGISFLGLNVGGTKSRSSSVPRVSMMSGSGTLPPMQYPTSSSEVTSGANMNMYALHENNDYDDSKSGQSGGSYMDENDTGGMLNDSSILNTSVNFNVGNLKEMLKCISCHRFLFPPILQCAQGHMTCKSCFEIKVKCEKCHSKMLEVPAKFAEMITEQFKVQCIYAEKGCKEAIPFKGRRDHEEICQFKPVQCPEFDCNVTRPMNEIFKHFRIEHHHHFVNAHGNVFNGDIRCDDSNMIMGVERKWAPTMMKLDAERGGVVSEEPEDNDEESSNGGCNSNIAVNTAAQGTQHFFLEILRTKHGVWHMWIWYLGEPEEAGAFRCEIAIRRRNQSEDSELKYSGRVHSIRIPPHRIILSGCLLSFSDYTAAHFRYLGEGHQGHPVIDYRVSVSRARKPPTNNEKVMAAGLSKMLRRFSIDTTSTHAKQNKPNFLPQDTY